jgi:hypothetical protein
MAAAAAKLLDADDGELPHLVQHASLVLSSTLSRPATTNVLLL